MELAQNGGKKYVIYFEFGSFEPYNTGFKTFLLKRIDAKWAKRFFQGFTGANNSTPGFFHETNRVVLSRGGILLAKIGNKGIMHRVIIH